ncbi:MAG: hypothetical protein KBT29_12050 [Prevotellaceae bacterium]|nr:hypothetical protein [Candidatus Minthosoma caballi]
MDNKKIIWTLMTVCSLLWSASADAQQNGDSIAEYQSFDKYRYGGYGEMVAAFKDYGNNRFYGNAEGNPKTHRNTISIPRFVLAGDYKFDSKWILGVEIEFESGGTGTAYELENTENGEYETEVEKGGEVAIEQFHITRLIHPAFNVRAGHIIVPVGQNNAHHEPIIFFGTVRPEGETTIIPNTWHETGLELFGQLGRRYASFNYQAMVMAGLNGNGFDRNKWAGGAGAHIFEEDNFSQPGYAFRLNYTGVPGLRLGTAFYFCKNVGDNSDKEQTYKGMKKMPVRIWNADAQYKCKYAEARCNFLVGNLTNSDALSQKNNKLSNKSPYSRLTPIAHKAVAYGGELGINIRGIVNDMRCPDIIPFARYEYYNPQEEGRGIDVMDPRLKTSMWVAGLNWRALPNLVVKADYTTRSIGGGKYNKENEFAVGVAFAGWMFKK